jgi:TetR/AcrR family transcriptional repressor of bet genes
VVAATFRKPFFTPERVLVWVALASTSHWSPELAEIHQKLYRPYRRGCLTPSGAPPPRAV